MNQTHKISFLSVLILLFLLPLFFVPASILPLGGAKVVVLTLGVLVAFLALVVDILREGKLEMPSHMLLWGVGLFPLVYFLSAFFGIDTARSLFGYGFEVGTFGYILLSAVLFGIVAHVSNDKSRILRALGAFFFASSLLVIFAVVKLLTNGSFPVWGIFSGNMGNPVGAWTDYSLVFGLLATFSALALALLPVKKLARGFLCASLFISLLLVAIINFSTTWVLLLVTSVVTLVYLLTAEKKILSDGVSEDSLSRKTLVWPTILILAVSLIFIINPVVSSTQGSIGNAVSSSFNVSNVDVRPSFTTTLDISKQVLNRNALLGSGPNTFDQNWLLYKPQAVNNSAFWNVSFPFGFGFIPTQIASVGVLGILLWLVFFLYFLLLGLKVLGHLPKENHSRFALVSSFLLAFFIWVATFLYVPSRAVLALAFIFTGLLVAGARTSGIIQTREIVFSNKTVTNFITVFLAIILVMGSAAMTLKVFQGTVSAYHFQRAVVLSNTEGASVDEVESEIVKATTLTPLDTYYRAISQVNVARAQAALNATEGTAEENQQKLQSAISNSIASLQQATVVAPGNYENWLSLGSIYSSLVPAPFSLDGAYEVAQSAYAEALKRNPTSPEIPLLLARLELDNGNLEGARTHINESISLKTDYADAYFLLTQLEISQNNVKEAIKSAETASFLSPNNAGIFLQLGLLKYTDKDWVGARDALNRALVIIPDYANAKYYLGLTLDKLGQNDKAVLLFQDLAKTNPDNQEVAQILDNLENGKDPLLNLPSSASNLNQREEPPVN
ncbi:MAG: tetratricopeptide repeat protein [bacterium]